MEAKKNDLMERIQRLRTVAIFSELEEEQLEDLSFLAAPCAFPAQHQLFAQGECSDGMYLIEEGEVLISVRMPGDDLIEVARAGPGDLVGEMGLLDRCARSAKAETQTPIRGLFFSQRRFEMLRSDLRPAAFRILQPLLVELCRRIRKSHQELLNLPYPLGKQSAEQRRWRTGDFQPVQKTLAGWPPELCEAGTTVPPAAQAALPFFQNLAHVDRTRLLEQGTLVSLPRNTELQRPDLSGQDAYLVIRGAVTETIDVGGASETLRVHGPGALVGIPSAISNEPPLSALTVREHASLLQLDASLAKRWMQGGSVEASRFMEYAASALVTSLRSATAFMSRTAVQEANVERKRTQTGIMAAIEI